MNVKQKQIIVKSLFFDHENFIFLSKYRFLDFHCEQAWDRWLSVHANGVQQFKEAILAHL